MSKEKTELAIAVREDFSFNAEQSQMIRDSFLAGVSESKAKVLIEVARARGLNPILGQIHYVRRKSKEGETISYQVGIDGLRLIAERSGKYDGQDEPEFEFNAAGHPVACKVRVYRKDWSRPAVGVAHWSEYVQRKYDESVTAMWATKPRLMLAKCAEALALRKAFPNDMGGLYTAEEMAAEAHAEPAQPSSTQAALPAQNERIKAAVARVAPKAEAVDAIFTESKTIDVPPPVSAPKSLKEQVLAKAQAQREGPPPSPPPPTQEREPGDDSELDAVAEYAESMTPSPVVNFGSAKGKRLNELNAKDLAYYLRMAEASVNDEKKARFLAQNTDWLRQVHAEMAKRGGK